MPDPQGRTHVAIPRTIMETMVLPTQERIREQTGIPVTVGMVVRRLVERGFAADISNCTCQLHSPAN